MEDGTPAALITGAGGFIGSRVADHLAQNKWRTGALGFNATPVTADAAHDGAVSVEALRAIARQLGALTTIVHCAGGSAVGRSWAAPAQDFERSVTSTLHVLEFMRTHAPGARLVFLSSAAVYGASDAEPLTEDLPKRPVSPYGTHKAMAEDLVLNWADAFGLDVVIVRLFSVYGAGLKKQLLWDLSQRALAERKAPTLFGDGDERRDFFDVRDAVALIATLADPARRPPRVLNGGSGVATTIRDLASVLLTELGINGAPRFGGEVKPGDPRTLVADTSRARALGFAPAIDLRDGVARYAAWVKSLQA